MSRPRVCAALALLVIGAVNVAGCGGVKQADLGPPLAQPTTQASAPEASTTQAAPTATAAKPAAKAQRAAKPRAHAAPTKTPGTVTTKTATPPAVAKKPAVKRKPGNDAPLACLLQANLYKPGKRGDGLWRATERKSGKPVFVDGPYKSPAEAKISAESLAGVQDAARGGLYVVSAAVRSKAAPVVRDVAKCLQARG